MTALPEPAALECLDVGPVDAALLEPHEVLAVAKALGNPIRLDIVQLFHVRCPRNVRDIQMEVGLAVSTVSVHLRILRDAGVLKILRDSSMAWHCLNRSVLLGLASSVDDLARRTSGDIWLTEEQLSR